MLTGTTSGIGRVLARELVAAGAVVVMVCRNLEKAARFQQELLAQRPGATVEVYQADLSVLSSVRTAAASLLSRHPVIHVLINNAGEAFLDRRTTEEGWERTWAGNYLGPTLLTELLLGALERGAPSRIVNVSSTAHARGRLNWGDLQAARSYTARGAYAQSKLAQLIQSYQWAQELHDRGVTVNAVHPGLVRSGFLFNAAGLRRLLLAAFYFVFGLPPAKGAAPVLFLAASPQLQGVTGRYYDRFRPVRSSARSYDPELGAQLAAVTREALGPPPAPSAPSGGL